MPRRDYTKVAFAATGDTATIPGTTQPDGSVSMPQGFGFDYERDNGAGGGTPDPLAKNIEREDMNGILNEITASVGEIQQNGLAIWATTGAPYPINAQVRHNDINWQSLTTNNSDEPGVGAGLTSWKNASAPVQGSLLAVRKFTASGTYTPTPGAGRAVVEAVGGGGGGGGMAPTGAGAAGSAGGGASGTYGLIYIDTGLASMAISIGAGGAGGVGGAPGSAGGTTSVGVYMSCPGGFGGGTGSGVTGPSVTGAPGNSGGPASGAVVSSNGSGASSGIALSNSSVLSGTGGASAFGAGGTPSGLNATGGSNGNSGAGPGAGGSGAAAVATGAPVTGGQGFSGQVLFYEYT